MALSNEDLLAISQLLDTKLASALQPVKDELTDVKLHIENILEPQIHLPIENYVPAAKRYEKSAVTIDSLQADMDILKHVVTEHSEKLQRLA